MNARFVAKMERAFELGQERRGSAANQVKLPTTGHRPLQPDDRDGPWTREMLPRRECGRR
jgi:hypothetical protein